MFMQLRKSVIFCWDFVFNHEVSPLRHIPDVAVRHYVLQLLGFMWAVAFAVAAGSYTFMAVSVIVRRDNQDETRATIRMRRAPGVG